MNFILRNVTEDIQKRCYIAKIFSAVRPIITSTEQRELYTWIMCIQLNFWDLTSDSAFLCVIRRPNGKSDRIKAFNTFESLMKVFGYVFGIRFVLKTTIFEIMYTVAKYVTF